MTASVSVIEPFDTDNVLTIKGLTVLFESLSKQLKNDTDLRQHVYQRQHTKS